MSNNRIINHQIFWPLIVGIFVIPVSMIASDYEKQTCRYSCASK